MNILVGYPPSRPCKLISDPKGKTIFNNGTFTRIHRRIKDYLKIRGKTEPIERLPAKLTLNPSIYVFDQKFTK